LVNARIVVGISDILSFAKIPPADKKEIETLLFELGKHINKAQLSSKKVMDEYEIQKNQIKNLDITKKGICPSLLTIHTCEVETSINFTKKALRYLTTIVGIVCQKQKLEIFEKGYKKGRFDSVLEDLKKDFPNDSTLLAILEEGAPWAAKLSLYRDNDEHPKDFAPFVKNYRIDADLNIIRPMLYDGTPLFEFLQESSTMILLFSEALLVSLLFEYIDENKFEIIEIPEQIRDTVFPKRFKILPKGLE